jgi:hypothetical protein
MNPARPAPHDETSHLTFNSTLAALNRSDLRPLDAALIWFDFGFDVIPVATGTKRTAVPWDPWLQQLSRDAVTRRWSRHPDHDIGVVVGPRYLVLDADSAESVNALYALERQFGLAPRLRIKTPRGQHHYFLIAPGAVAKTSARSVAANAHRIDVKAGRTLVVLPPSGGRSIIEFGSDQ